jgi:DNA-binding response OmpR family regulator
MVLLVEDDELIRSMTSEMLGDLGCKVRQASTAQEARKILNEGLVDILLTDVGLPGISGLQLASDARSHRANLRLVLATGDGSLRSEAGLLDAVLLVKPYSCDALREALETALETEGTCSRP